MSLIPKTKENLENCQCSDCPSYGLSCKIKVMPENLYKLMNNFENSEHFEGMYCAFEKSHCITESKGCMCYSCENYKKYGLNHQEFCLSTGGLCKTNRHNKTPIHPIHHA